VLFTIIGLSKLSSSRLFAKDLLVILIGKNLW